MSKYQVADVRNLVLAGHGASGKTSLADALLWFAKAVDRKGSVADKTSFSDTDDEEHKRGFSIDSACLNLTHAGKQVRFIDTPGYPDFVGAALGSLNAVETAAICVSAVNGIGVNTRRMFAEAGKRGLARMLIVTKLDGDNVHFAELIANLQATFGKGCVLMNAPINPGPNFSGIVSVVNPPASAPAGCATDLDAARALLIEAAVEADEALMEKYLVEGNISDEELNAALPGAVLAGTVVPIFCVSAKKDIGLKELLDGVVTLLPSPANGAKRTGMKGRGDKAEKIELKPDPAAPFVGQVFKTVHDKFVGTLSFIRVLQGTFHPEQLLVIERTGKTHRTGGLQLMQGSKHVAMGEAIPGDIVAVAKIDDLNIGDTVSHHAGGVVLSHFSYPTPMFGLAIEPKNRGDEQKISTSLHKICHEDPTFHVTRDMQTKEMVISGLSQLHLEVVQHRIKKRFELEVLTHEPKIPYRETILGPGEGSHRHKKQSGGRGQFGEVHLRIYPIPREITTSDQFFANFATKDKFEKLRLDHCHYDPAFNFGFVDTIVGGTIPAQFVPAIEKGCKELLERGALAGYRIQDVCVEVYFGKFHDVDSSEAAFKTAGRIAFRKSFENAHGVLLEPVVTLEVTAPSRFTGAILGDLNTKRARVENQDSLPGDLAVIKAKVPLAEVARYSAQLGSMTQGQGSYSMEFSGRRGRVKRLGWPRRVERASRRPGGQAASLGEATPNPDASQIALSAYSHTP
jgi:elongation factor G